MKIHNITGFIKWHIRKFKIGMGHMFTLNILFIFGNILFVPVNSPWYLRNLAIGMIPVVGLWIYVWIWWPIRESYKKYQKEKQDLLNTIDKGETYK